MLLVRGPDGLTGGRVIDLMVTHLDLYPTLCDVAGIDPPDGLQGRSLLALVQGHTDRLHDEITYHTAYDPQRAIRAARWKYVRIFHDYLHPVLPNVDERAAKDPYLAAGWAERSSPAEQLYDLVLDPEEGNNLAGDPAHAEVLADLRHRLEVWMRETDDPLLTGPVPVPPGASINEQWQRSPDESLRGVPDEP